MKIKKVLSVALAASVVVATAVTPVAAAIKCSLDNTWLDGGTLFYDLAAEGFDPDSVNGQTVTISFTVDDSDGFGGGIMFNSGENGWQQSEDYYWGNEGKAINATGADGSYTLTFTVPAGSYTANDLSLNEGTWGQLSLQQWWGNDMTVTDIKVGNGAPAKAAEDTSSDDSEDTADAADTTDSSSDSDDATTSDTTTTGTSDSSDSSASANAEATVAKTADVAPVAGVVLAICGISLVAVALKRRSALQ